MRRPASLAVLLLALAAVFPACESVPVTGRSQLQLVSASDEVQMGTKAYEEILSKAKLSTDANANALVTRVGTRIASATGRSDLPWEFKVIDDPKTVNAFALPGGKVAVYTGILPVARDEAGLAAVLGHEVAHVLARHSAERVSQQLAAQGFAQAIGTSLGFNTQMVQAGSGVLIQMLQRPWGRQQESEADHLGLIYMAKAGYDPRAAKDLWVRMGQGSSRAQAGTIEQFLATHPSEETRVRQIEGWLPEALKHYKPSS